MCRLLQELHNIFLVFKKTQKDQKREKRDQKHQNNQNRDQKHQNNQKRQKGQIHIQPPK